MQQHFGSSRTEVGGQASTGGGILKPPPVPIGGEHMAEKKSRILFIKRRHAQFP